MNGIIWKVDHDAGAASARQGREGGEVQAICHHHYCEWTFPASACQGNRAGGQRVSSLNVLVNVGSTIQMLVPTFIFDAQGKSWFHVTVPLPGQWRPPSLVSRSHNYSTAARLWGPNIHSSPVNLFFLWLFTLFGPH